MPIDVERDIEKKTEISYAPIDAVLSSDWLVSPPKWVAIVGVLIVLLGASFAGLRSYRNYAPASKSFSFDRTGQLDFHNGAYFPSKAFRDGINPYSVEASDKYLMARAAPPYSPVVFILHLPYTYLSITQADIAYFVTNVFLIGLIAWCCVSMTGKPIHWSWWIWCWGFLVFSRPGHVTLYTGYFTALMVVGCFITIHFADRYPKLSGLGMVLASLKPTYIIPLIILMLCRRNFKATLYGFVFCSIGAGIGLGWMVSHSSLQAVVDGVKEGQAAFDADSTEIPINTWTRIDTLGVVSKFMHWRPDNKFYFVAMMIALIIPGVAIWKVSKYESNRGAAGLSSMILVLALLITIYHHSYDCLLVSLACFAVVVGGRKVCSDLKTIECWVLGLLLVVPAINYFSTMRFRDLLGLENVSLAWNVVTSVNGVCLLLALLILLGAAVRVIRNGKANSNSNSINASLVK